MLCIRFLGLAYQEQKSNQTKYFPNLGYFVRYFFLQIFLIFVLIEYFANTYITRHFEFQFS